MVGVAGFEPTTPPPPHSCANPAALHSDGAPYRGGRYVAQRGASAPRVKTPARSLAQGSFVPPQFPSALRGAPHARRRGSWKIFPARQARFPTEPEARRRSPLRRAIGL